MSNDKNLPAVSNTNKSVALNDNGLRAGSLIDQSIRNLTQEQVSALGVKAAEKAIDIEEMRAKILIKSEEGRRHTEDHIEAFDKLDKRGKLTSQKVVSDIETGAGKMTIESKSGATCFVATATYKNEFHPNVIFLRNFRDFTLSRHKLGRAFIAWYWDFGPVLASYVEGRRIPTAISRVAIDSIVRVLKFINFKNNF
jgi:hypothetical protein